MPMTRSRRLQSMSLASTSTPTRLKSFRPNRCWTPIRLSACRSCIHHWSFGKRFVYEENGYRNAAHHGLAYEIVINSNPCITYLMEENTMAMQTLVTRPRGLRPQSFLQEQLSVPAMDRCRRHPRAIWSFRKKYIAECEERHGTSAVEAMLDSAHALMDQGVFRYRPPAAPVLEEGAGTRTRERWNMRNRPTSDLWRTLPRATGRPDPDEAERDAMERKKVLNLPEENLLYFLEKNSPDPRALAAGIVAHRAGDRPVFLSAAPDQGDERGLCHLCALYDHEQAVRSGQDQRRRDAGNAPQPFQRGVPAAFRRSPFFPGSTPMRWVLR